MKQKFLIAMAYMSVVIGGGFASGREVIEFFTGYGAWGIGGSLVAAFLFAFVGMQIAQISSRMQAKSHNQVLARLFGSTGGALVDYLLIFFLFGVGVIMLAGAGSTFAQQFGWDRLTGSIVMAVVVVLTLCLNLKSIIYLISAVIPFLLLVILSVMAYAVFNGTFDVSAQDLHAEQFSVINLLGWEVPSWFMSGVLYAAFNVGVGFPMLAVIGGMTKSESAAGQGGIIGGLGLGVLIVFLNIALYLNIDKLHAIEVPTLLLSSQMHPLLGYITVAALFAMIYSTAVGMFFAFASRWAAPNSSKFRVIAVLSTVVGVVLSQFGFGRLVGSVYPLMGVLGVVIIIAIMWYWLKTRKAA
ncbi:MULTISPECIES: YkvI family membrane protein [Oligella]|uniref:Uncharacterized membrane protein n=1 Tax=Oligella urethralis TaxID=90245 RepID=A0A2X1UT40_9BURK|nr:MULTISPECIES: hypothetical protein [Oligella]OFS84071.1 hypothetical protein HMPREF3144_07665 [Oligella sp. HMSC05A10]SPY07601.1 Uncharacterized membrane protein [Oligella urethralis]